MSAAVLTGARLGFDILHEAFEQSAVGLAVASLDGQLVEVNRAFCALLGYDRHDVQGQSFARFTHPDDVSRDNEALASVVRGGDLGLVDKRYIRRDGSEIWVRRMASVLRDDAGQPRFVLGAYVDLTEQRRSARDLEQQM